MIKIIVLSALLAVSSAIGVAVPAAPVAVGIASGVSATQHINANIPLLVHRPVGLVAAAPAVVATSPAIVGGGLTGLAGLLGVPTVYAAPTLLHAAHYPYTTFLSGGGLIGTGIVAPAIVDASKVVG